MKAGICRGAGMRIPVCTDGKRHYWKAGWVCEKCGIRKADLKLIKTPPGVKKCVWCGTLYDKKYEPCNAPDGDGHLWKGGNNELDK